MVIREFSEESDLDGVRACLIELQDLERQIDPRMPLGYDIANEYIADTLSKCTSCAGTIFVVDNEGEIAGYAAVLAKVRSDSIDDGNLEYAYLADLIVRESYRGKGLGRELMSAAEVYARTRGAKWLRVCAVAGANSNVKAVAALYGGVPSQASRKITRLPPMLILHGDSDIVVPVEEAYALEEFVEERARTYTIKIYPGAGHGFDADETSFEAHDSYKQMSRFFAVHLASAEDGG